MLYLRSLPVFLVAFIVLVNFFSFNAEASKDGNSVVFGIENDSSLILEDAVFTSAELSACGKIPFVDVSSNNKNYNDIFRMWCEGIVKGRDSNHFDPTGSMKRDEASKILARVFGYATQTSNENIDSTSFSDLPAKSHLAFYIQVLADAGYYPDEVSAKKFRPDDNLTYSEAVRVIRLLSGKRVSITGYASTSTITRGDFTTLVLSLFQ